MRTLLGSSLKESCGITMLPVQPVQYLILTCAMLIKYQPVIVVLLDWPVISQACASNTQNLDVYNMVRSWKNTVTVGPFFSSSFILSDSHITSKQSHMYMYWCVRTADPCCTRGYTIGGRETKIPLGSKINTDILPVVIYSLCLTLLSTAFKNLGAGFKSRLWRMLGKVCYEAYCIMILNGCNKLCFTLVNGSALPANV